MRCSVCGEWYANHLILGVMIHPWEWHAVFTSKGRALKPSDAHPYVIEADDVYYVSIPAQRSLREKLLARQPQVR